MTCKTHPDAPHGFVRGAGHSEDRYVCECEFWEEPKMNERIKELALQAKQSALDAMIKITDKEEALKVYSETYDTKFAELIIRECLNQCYNRGMNDELYAGQLKAATYIEEHFGVEEK
jgi:hypothetical protein